MSSTPAWSDKWPAINELNGWVSTVEGAYELLKAFEVATSTSFVLHKKEGSDFGSKGKVKVFCILLMINPQSSYEITYNMT